MALTQILVGVALFVLVCSVGMGLIVGLEWVGGRLAMRWRKRTETIMVRDGEG